MSKEGHELKKHSFISKQHLYVTCEKSAN